MEGSTVRNRLKRLGLGALNFAFVLGLVFGTQALIRGRIHDNAGLVILSVVVFGGYLAGSRWIERRPPPELAGARGAAEFAEGVGLGVALFSVVMGLLWALGSYQPAGRGVTTGIGTGALVALMAGIVEETLVRGFLFRLIEIVGGTWLAVLISSALFGAAHASNPGATVVSSVAIALEAGVLLAAAYAATGRLWLPIGLHAGWNFTEGSLFGMAVSGQDVGKGVIAGSLKGPTILTGGVFGPEASVVAVVVCLAVGLALLRRMVQLGRVQPPLWKAAKPRTMA
jgi:uncharacterized protein